MSTTAAVLEQLFRIAQPRDPAPLQRALEGTLEAYGVDGAWEPHYMGRAQGPPGAFGDDAFLNGAQALAFLSARLPVGDPVRARLPTLYRAMLARLENPKLLLFGGFPDKLLPNVASKGAWVHSKQHYLYFCPVNVKTDEQRAVLRAAATTPWPNDTYPWSSLFPAWEAFTSPGFGAVMARLEQTPLKSGQWEMDPRASAPALVEAAHQRYALSTESATLLLQLLALVDCGDALLGEVNGWTKAQLQQHGAPLVDAKLVVAVKKPRADRKLTLPGLWDGLKAPHPATERVKLPLYGATLEGKTLAAPLGRMLPLRPLHELFAAAWEAHLAERGAEQPRQVTPHRDWISELRAAPDDDGPRLVYADWLLEQGDAHGELIRVQCQLAQQPTPQLEAQAKALLEAHEARWLGEVHHFLDGQRWSRGFVTEITAHAPTFAKGAAKVFEVLPLLEGFVFSGSVSPAQVRALAGCPEFSRFSSLDTGVDNYFPRIELLEALLASPHFPRLRRLRIGNHRTGDGLGGALAKALVACAPLAASLEVLQLDGQNLGRAAMTNNRLGLEALDVLLRGLPNLKTLRVPYNGFDDRDARDLAKQLTAGLAPKLERLDLSNTLDTKFVTKAVAFFHNRTTAEGQRAVDVALTERRGQPLPAAPPPPLPSVRRGQQGRFPFAEHAKTGRSRCVVCREPIAADALRIGIERTFSDVGGVTSWVHAGCRDRCPELQELGEALDARLTANSAGAWPSKP